MSYIYTDHHGDTVAVKTEKDGVWVTINEGRGGAAIAFGMAEAQRFADAVMEAVIEHEDRRAWGIAVKLRAAYSGISEGEARENFDDFDPPVRREGFMNAARYVLDRERAQKGKA